MPFCCSPAIFSQLALSHYASLIAYGWSAWLFVHHWASRTFCIRSIKTVGPTVCMTLCGNNIAKLYEWDVGKRSLVLTWNKTLFASKSQLIFSMWTLYQCIVFSTAYFWLTPLSHRHATEFTNANSSLVGAQLTLGLTAQRREIIHRQHRHACSSPHIVSVSVSRAVWEIFYLYFDGKVNFILSWAAILSSSSDKRYGMTRDFVLYRKSHEEQSIWIPMRTFEAAIWQRDNLTGTYSHAQCPYPCRHTIFWDAERFPFNYNIKAALMHHSIDRTLLSTDRRICAMFVNNILDVPLYCRWPQYVLLHVTELRRITPYILLYVRVKTKRRNCSN